MLIAPIWGEASSTHPANQQHRRHYTEPAGPLGRCDPLFYVRRSHCQALCLTSVLLVFYFFALPFSCLTLLDPVLSPLEDFSSHLPGSLHVNTLLSLTSLTFLSLSVISYLALTEATGMKTCFCDTWPHFCSHWFMVSLSLNATVSVSP